MLLVGFHGGSGGTNNLYGYSTKSGALETKTALDVPKTVTLDELRAMVIYQGNLFVANGWKKDSCVLVFSSPPRKGPKFEYLDTLISAGQSINHPFGIAFDSSSPHCYVSDQDTNVVSKVKLSSGKHGKVKGSLKTGCQSSFLTGKYPPPAAFLDGTFAASQIGVLAGVSLPNVPNVSQANGGLGVTGKGKPIAASNSVRDVAIANGILFVCDEVDRTVNMYDLGGGKFLGSGSLGASPTHLAINQGGLWVSAGDTLFWSVLPKSIASASLSFQPIAISPPKKHKFGGISFDNSGNVYVIFQLGTHTTGSGSISKYSVVAGSPPVLPGGQTFATMTNDTPEFCLWVSHSHWPSRRGN